MTQSSINLQKHLQQSQVVLLLPPDLFLIKNYYKKMHGSSLTRKRWPRVWRTAPRKRDRWRRKALACSKTCRPSPATSKTSLVPPSPGAAPLWGSSTTSRCPFLCGWIFSATNAKSFNEKLQAKGLKIRKDLKEPLIFLLVYLSKFI